MRLRTRRLTTFSSREGLTLTLAVLLAIIVTLLVLLLQYLVVLSFDAVNALDDLNIGYWWILIPMASAGTLVGFIIWKLSPEAEGPGLHVAASSYHVAGGKLRSRSGPVKVISTLLTVGSGAPMGLVSPSSMIGFSLGSAFGRRLQSNRDRWRTLTLCGMAAAISALMETPLGAAVFAVEIAYSNRILYRRFFYCLAASITAYILSHIIKPTKPLLELASDIPTMNAVDLLLMALIALSVTLVGIGFIVFYQFIHDQFLKLSWKGADWMRPALGMLIAGIIVIPVYGVLMDLGYVGGFSGRLIPLEDINTVQMLIISVILLVSTALIAGSGNSGGLFMPIMAAGGMLGIVISSGFTDAYPLIFAVVGISAALATTLNVPLAAPVICMELFGLPAFLPALFGSVAGYFIGRHYVIYHEIRLRSLGS